MSEAALVREGANGSCPPFEEGNALSLKHGAYATIALRPRAREIAEALWSLLPDETRLPMSQPAIDVAALAAARIERATAALEDAEPGDDFARLEQNLRGWVRLYLATLSQLGMTPRSMAALGLDFHAARRAQAAADRLKIHLAEREAASS